MAHVTARGDHRQVIFSDDRDHGHFVELVEEMRERYRVGVMAYVCMGTHDIKTARDAVARMPTIDLL